MCEIDFNKFLVLSWGQLFSDTLRLCRQIKESGYLPDVIVVIARGGWVVGRVVSDVLKVSDVASLGVKFYEDVNKKSKRPIITQPLNVDVSEKNVLLLDEVVDTGKTLVLAHDHVKTMNPRQIKTAVLYKKPWSLVKPNYYVREVDKWIVFPYELRETLESVMRILGLKKRANAMSVLNRLSCLVSQLGVNESDIGYILEAILKDS